MSAIGEESICWPLRFLVTGILREAHFIFPLPRVERDFVPFPEVAKLNGNIPKRQLEGLKRVYAKDLMDPFISDSHDLTCAVEFVTDGGGLGFS